MNKRSLLALLAVFVIVSGGGVYYIVEHMAYSGDAAPTLVRIGVLPDMSETELERRYHPLLNYLSDETGLEFRLVLPANYAELLHWFGADQVDLALFGGLTFVQAHALYQAEPLVMRDVDTRFISVFVARSSDAATELSDFEGRVLAFGDALSTSGHLMPRYFLENSKQINPETFFDQIVYSGAHDQTAYLVRDGRADIGAANAEIINAMLRDGRLQQEELRVVGQTPPYPDYVWAVSRRLNEAIKTRLRDAYLRLDLDEDHHRQILAGLGASGFVPAGHRTFQPLHRIAADLELLSAK